MSSRCTAISQQNNYGFGARPIPSFFKSSRSAASPRAPTSYDAMLPSRSISTTVGNAVSESTVTIAAPSSTEKFE